MKKQNIEMTAGTTTQEEPKMKKQNIEMTAGTTTQEEPKMKKQNIEEARKIILDEYSYVTESIFYIKEKGYSKIEELRVINEIITRGLEKMYNARIERDVRDEDLGRDIDELRILLHRKSGYAEAEIEKHITAKNEATVKAMILKEKQEEQKMKKADKINEEISNASEELATKITEVLSHIKDQKNIANEESSREEVEGILIGIKYTASDAEVDHEDDIYKIYKKIEEAEEASIPLELTTLILINKMEDLLQELKHQGKVASEAAVFFKREREAKWRSNRQ